MSELFTGPLRTQIIHASLLRILYQLQFCPISLPRHNPHPPHPPKKNLPNPPAEDPTVTVPTKKERHPPRSPGQQRCLWHLAEPVGAAAPALQPAAGRGAARTPARPGPLPQQMRGVRASRPPPGGTRTAEAGRQLAPSSGGARRRRAARAEGEKKRKI